MIKNRFFTRYTFVYVLSLVVLIACQPLSEPAPSDDSLPEGYCTYPMRWEQAQSVFSSMKDDVGTRATAEQGWEDGDKIFLQFDNQTTGYAVYSAAHTVWSVSFKSGLPASGNCQLYYFKNAVSASLSAIECNEQTIIYACEEGLYQFDGSLVTITAEVGPYAPRLRFSATEACQVAVRINQPTVAINTSAITLTYEPKDISLSTAQTAQNGKYYTPYIYPKLTADSKVVVKPSYSSSTFERLLTSTQLPDAGTGVLSLPSDNYFIGWTITEEEGLTTGPDANGHAYVDLGLPSGLLWATCNVGASSAEEYGNYYAWGETSTKTTYDWSTYKWCKGSSSTMTKYCIHTSYGNNGFTDGKTALELSDDAARVNMGGDWRMPTKEEQDELRSKCTWTWTSLGGKSGYKVVGPNGNFIFLPAAGYRGGGSLDYAGSYGGYWSSALGSSYSCSAYGLYFSSSDCDWGSDLRCRGRSVRGVLPSLAQ